jgi:hypothetical protein
MIMTDEEVDARLNSENNLVNRLKVIKEIPKPGRTEGAKGIPLEVKKLIGVLANNSDETQQEIADVFGVSNVTVSNSARGLSSGGTKNDALAKTVNEHRPVSKIDDAHDKALDALVATLGTLGGRLTKTDDGTIKTRDLARIASDMSRVASNLKPAEKQSDPLAVNTQVVVYMPHQKKETDYDVIDA